MRRRSSLALSGQRGGRLIVGFLGLVLSACFAVGALASIPMGWMAQPGPGVFPLVCAIFMALASLGVIWEQLRSTGADVPINFPHGADLRRLLWAGAGITAYVVLTPYLGHLIASFLMSVVLIKLLRPASWRSTLLAAAATSVLIWLFFAIGLAVPLPEWKLT